VPSGSARHQDNRPFAGTRANIDLGDGRRIAVEAWEPDPGATTAAEPRTIYLAHGWGGWRGQLGAFVQPFLDVGRRVVAFDAPSHGESSPSLFGPGRATGVDFVDALVAVSSHHGGAEGVVAHSMGTATTALAVRDGLPAARLAFIAAAPDPITSTDELQNVLGYGRRTRGHFFEHLSRLARRPLEDFNALTVSDQEDVPPALIIHDRDDTRSPYKGGAKLAAAWPESEMVTTEGLGHQRILLDPGVIKLTVDYLTTPST
jgi:pimeloyl-ACP methyl ester carboxylesterase